MRCRAFFVGAYVALRLCLGIEMYVVEFACIMMLISKIYVLISVFWGVGILFNISEIIAMLNEGEQYSMVYQISIDNPHFWLKSKSHFIAENVLKSFLYLYVVITGMKASRSASGKWSLVFLWAIVVGQIIYVWRSHYLWVQSGYDHYPGFDPYLF
jgi:hypothetical protein